MSQTLSKLKLMARSSKPKELEEATSGQISLVHSGSGRAQSRPFIKWAGGKSQLLPELISRMPKTYYNYFEPFLGGAALFFKLRPDHAHLSDINPALVETYTAVKNNVDGLVKDLKKHVYEKEYYYEIRSADRTKSFPRWSKVRRASRFIYLNKTCYNGLHRVNSRGEFNTPFGKYKNPRILDEPNLRACSKALSDTNIEVGSFLDIESKVKKGDFVYFDPPYAPLSKTSNFTSFAQNGFGDDAQRELAELCERLDKKGALFMLSNSSAPLILGLYRNFKIERVKALRAINSKAKNRGPVDEVIVRNY